MGIKKIRRLNMSRGGREGNNAFTRDQNVKQIDGFVDSGKIMRWNLSMKYINELLSMKTIGKDELCNKNVIEAIR